jgi:hypothetical protein
VTETNLLNLLKYQDTLLRWCDNAITSFHALNHGAWLQIGSSEYFWRMWRTIGVWGPFSESNFTCCWCAQQPVLENEGTVVGRSVWTCAHSDVCQLGILYIQDTNHFSPQLCNTALDSLQQIMQFGEMCQEHVSLHRKLRIRASKPSPQRVLWL